MEGQPISVEALERPVEENRPPPYPVEGAGTGPMLQTILISKQLSNISSVLIFQKKKTTMAK